MELTLSDLALRSEQLLNHGLSHPGPLTLLLVFFGGLITSLGPCSLSLLPVTIAFLAGFNNQSNPFLRSLFFSTGIICSLVILGSLSGLAGSIYGQVPETISALVGILAVTMGLNLIGIFQLPLPAGPDPLIWQERVPAPLAPVAAGLAFGLASSACTTPVLAVLLGWIAQNGNPLIGVVLLALFGLGQVLPLLIAGTAAGIVPNLLALRPIAQWIPPISGVVLLITGLLSLISRVI